MSTNDTATLTKNKIAEEPPSLVLSFGNILEKFPEFLIHVLPYIEDRKVWTSIASCNKDVYEKSQVYLPPWPKFKLRVLCGYYNKLCNPVWSPDGSQIACIMLYSRTQHFYNKLVIFDQRRGLLRSDNNEQGWLSRSVARLKFSQDGSFLVSYDRNERLVKIWDYNSTNGYYQKLQEWNIKQELRIHQDRYGAPFRIDISPCSSYVVVLSNRHVLLKDVQNNGNTIKSIVLPENELGKQIMFSNIDGHHSILIRTNNTANKKVLIKIWRPRDVVDEDDPDITSPLIIILEQSNKWYHDSDFALSCDNSMIAMYGDNSMIEMYGGEEDKIQLFSIDNDNKSTIKSKFTLKQSFSRGRCRGSSSSSIHFTPDGKFISYFNENGLGFWNINTGREITDQVNISIDFGVVNFAPAGSSGQRVLVQDQACTIGGFYIASFWESSKAKNNPKPQETLKYK